MNEGVNRAVPLAVQIAGLIRTDIDCEILKPGEKIPTVRQIADRWDVSISTATQVHVILRTEGLTVGRPGLGTFVKDAATE